LGCAILVCFHPPHTLCAEIQQFLAEHEQLFSPRSYAETAVVFSVESDFRRVAQRDQFADNRTNTSGDEIIPFWQVAQALSDAAQPYDVVFFPDGDLRPDTITAEQLRQYRSLVLPDCTFLTTTQAQALLGYLEAGGRVLALGEPGANLSEPIRRSLVDHPGTTLRAAGREFQPDDLPVAPQLRIDALAHIAVHIQRIESGAAIHLIRYDYDEALDCVPALPSLGLQIRLPERFSHIHAHSPNGVVAAALEVAGDIHRIELRDLPLYSIVLLSND
jgi:hypothetical protein